MAALWITFNFLLIILAFYLILQLYQRIRLLQQTNSKQLTQEIEDICAAYLEDARAENDRLISTLNESLKTEPSSRQKSTTKRGRPSRAKKTDINPQVEEQDHDQSTPFSQVLKNESALQESAVEKKVPTAGREKNEWMPPVDEVSDKVEESLYLQALKLKNKGNTITEIAKELNRGRGEVELLLKFQGKG